MAAVLLLAAAVIGLILANTAAEPWVEGILSTKLGPAGTPWQLTIDHWVQDGLLAVFFLIAAIELRHEFTAGELRSPARALRPAIAAAGGVLVPIALYLSITGGSGQEGGWPIPTSTDVAFALGVLAIAGRGLLPQRIRAFLLALAIIDDLIGIVFIAVVFAHGVQLIPLLVAVLAVAVFAVLGITLARRMRTDGVDRDGRPEPDRILIVAVMVVVGIVAWGAMVASGIHPTIAGVALGFALPAGPGHHVRQAIAPAVNGLILPLFALTASFVIIPQVDGPLVPAFWGILVALPIGKLVGIAGATWLADRWITKERRRRMTLLDLATTGLLGGIGFTVSLLMASLAFANRPELDAAVTLAVLAASVLSAIGAIILLSIQVARIRAIARLRAQIVG
jgi:NhaA family Na+:H+ antiporter